MLIKWWLKKVLTCSCNRVRFNFLYIVMFYYLIIRITNKNIILMEYTNTKPLMMLKDKQIHFERLQILSPSSEPTFALNEKFIEWFFKVILHLLAFQSGGRSSLIFLSTAHQYCNCPASWPMFYSNYHCMFSLNAKVGPYSAIFVGSGLIKARNARN